MTTKTETQVVIVQLKDIFADPLWETSKEKVDEMRATIRSGKPLAGLVLHETQEAPGFTYGILDGFHRFPALEAEGITEHPATIVLYNAKGQKVDGITADLERAQYSLKQAPDILFKRAHQVIAKAFQLDLFARDPILYDSVEEENGTLVPLERIDVPREPKDAIWAFVQHQEIKKAVGLPAADWEQAIDTWIDERAREFGKTSEWLKYTVLGTDQMLGENAFNTKRRKDMPAYAALFAKIPQRDIRAMVFQRFLKENSVSSPMWLEITLDYIGCGPRSGKSPYPKRTQSEIISLLKAANKQLADYYRESARLVHEPEKSQQPPVIPSSVPKAQPLLVNPKNIFGMISPRFAELRREEEESKALQQPSQPATTSKLANIQPLTPISPIPVITPITHQPSPVISSTSMPKVSATPIFYAVKQLITALHEYDQAGGYWSNESLQADLVKAVTEIGQYQIAKGKDIA